MRMKMILCMSLLAVSCLCGCSQNEKVSLSETYDSENISAINMQIDSWQLKIMASADDDVHVTLDGGAAKGAKAPSAEIQDSVSSEGRIYLSSLREKLDLELKDLQSFL